METKKENLIDFIDDINVNKMKKLHFKHIAQRGEVDLYNSLNIDSIINTNGKPSSQFDVVTSTDEFIIYKVGLNVTDENDWDVKYPYRVLVYKNKTWERIPTVCATYDEALILYLSVKHINNADACKWIMKILDMPLPE